MVDVFRAQARERAYCLGVVQALRDLKRPEELADAGEFFRRALAPESEARDAWAAVAPEMLRELWAVMNRIGGTVPDLPALASRPPGFGDVYASMVQNAINPVVRWCGQDRAPAEEYRIWLIGDRWEIRFGGERANYARAKSLGWLQRILLQPDRMLKVADVIGDPEGLIEGDARLGDEPANEPEALAALHRRLDEINEEARPDRELSDRLKEEKKELLRQLKAGSNPKRTSALCKNFHKIGSQIRTFIRHKLAQNMPALAAHLSASLKIARLHFCYAPDPRITWKT
jgi:hypothetical protein